MTGEIFGSGWLLADQHNPSIGGPSANTARVAFR
jgi:hypothetical protein